MYLLDRDNNRTIKLSDVRNPISKPTKIISLTNIESVPISDINSELEYELDERDILDKVEFIVGKLYKIRGFDFIFKLTAICANRNSVIVSIVGSHSPDFVELSPDDCKTLGIRYLGHGHILLPDNLRWDYYKTGEIEEFNSSDLSTYPGSIFPMYQETIRYMILKIGGIKSKGSSLSVLNGKDNYNIEPELLISSLTVRLKKNLSGGWCCGDEISWSRIVSEKRGFDMVSDPEGNLFIILNLIGDFSKGFGIMKEALKNKKVSDLFDVSINVSITIDDIYKPTISKYDKYEDLILNPRLVMLGMKQKELFSKKNNMYWKRI